MGHMEEKRRRNTGDAGVLTRSPPTPETSECGDDMQFRSVTVCVQQRGATCDNYGFAAACYMGQQECQEKDGEDGSQAAIA